jgi:hypothetical protein
MPSGRRPVAVVFAHTVNEYVEHGLSVDLGVKDS